MKTLDDKYYEFCNLTNDIFLEYPNAEPCRYFIFKELLIKQKSISILSIIRYYLRSLIKYTSTKIKKQEADVIFWFEKRHKASKESLLPVIELLTKKNYKVKLLSDEVIELKSNYDIDIIKFNTPLTAPKWVSSFWKKISQRVDGLNKFSLFIYYYYYCLELVGRYREIDKILNNIKPNVIIESSTGLRNSAALVVRGNKLNITTITLQHGIVHAFYLPVISNYFLCWGESSLMTLKKFNKNEKRFISIGSPKHDRLKENYINDNLYKKYLDNGKKNMVFFSNGNDLIRNGKAPIDAVEWLSEIAKIYSDRLNIIIKLHPKEDGSLYNNEPDLTIVKNIDTFDLIAQADIIGSICSSVMTEAILFDKPILQFYKNSWPLLVDNYKYGLAIRINNLNTLKNELDLFLNGKIQNNNKIDFVFSNYGYANKKIVKFIRQKITDKY